MSAKNREANHWSPVDSPHKGQWRGVLMFSLICVWTKGWANNRDVGDLRRHRTHWIPLTKGQLRGKCFYLMTPSWIPHCVFPTILSLVHFGHATLRHPTVWSILLIYLAIPLYVAPFYNRYHWCFWPYQLMLIHSIIITIEVFGHTNLCWSIPLRWRHNGRDGVSKHQPHDCLLNRLFGRRSKKTSKLRVTGLCVGNSPGTGEYPAQMASNAENVSISWRRHVYSHYHWCFWPYQLVLIHSTINTVDAFGHTPLRCCIP